VISTFLVASVVAAVVGAGQVPTSGSAAAIPPPLAAMAETEREFAAAAKVKGVRDAFLEYFTEDAMFEPGGGSAKDQLRKQKPQPSSERELVWEPRTGDVAASGELGWLTGPGTFINHAGPDKTPRHTNYLSVWRKEPDGRWRVFIDLGTNLKAPATFAPGFTRFAFADRYTAKEPKAAAGDKLSAADRGLNERIASAGAAAAYADVLAPGARLHRDGVGALTEPSAVREWLTNATGMTAQAAAAESAASGDLGYSYGTYRLGSTDKSGTYLRIWTRDGQGRWRIVAEVLPPPR
jgi:ketosteroid isomerase-like protein